jgi:transposase-like protein
VNHVTEKRYLTATCHWWADSPEQVGACCRIAWQTLNAVHSTNPIERQNKEVKRCTDVVEIFPRAEPYKPKIFFY